MTRTFGAWFYCRTCGAQIAGPLQRLDDLGQIRLDPPDHPPDVLDLLPQGHFVLSERLIEAGTVNLGWPADAAIPHNYHRGVSGASGLSSHGDYDTLLRVSPPQRTSRILELRRQENAGGQGLRGDHRVHCGGKQFA